MSEQVYDKSGRPIGWRKEGKVWLWDNTNTPLVNKYPESNKPKRKSKLDEDKSLTELITGGKLNGK